MQREDRAGGASRRVVSVMPSVIAKSLDVGRQATAIQH